MPPLGICEQPPPAAPDTSEVGKKDVTATKHHPLLLSFPWEHTHLAAATAKCSAVPTHLISVTSQDPATRSSHLHGLNGVESFFHGLQVVGANHHI